MSTRAVYTFKDNDKSQEFHVYKHHDGYPQGAAQWIGDALPYAWPLPRYEACEFGAAFIAANKSEKDDKHFQGGSVYLTTHYNDHGDLDYRYEIYCINGKICVTAFSWGDTGTSASGWKRIFDGTLDEFRGFSENYMS